MALVLALKEGQDFYIDDEQFFVHEVVDDVSFRVRRERDSRVWLINDEKRTEIGPDVYLSAGDRPQPFLARVAIDAPRHVNIASGRNYRGAHEAVLRD